MSQKTITIAISATAPITPAQIHADCSSPPAEIARTPSTGRRKVMKNDQTLVMAMPLVAAAGAIR